MPKAMSPWPSSLPAKGKRGAVGRISAAHPAMPQAQRTMAQADALGLIRPTTAPPSISRQKQAITLIQQAFTAIKIIASLSALLLLPATGLAQTNTGQEVLNTAALAATCATCHGPAGQAPSAASSIPSLRGQSAARLEQRLLALQKHPLDNATNHAATTTDNMPDASVTVMPQLLQGLSAQQLQALAQWFATPATTPTTATTP